MSIYGLTLSNGDYGEGFLGSPGSKDLGENTSVALIKDETSPTFSFKAKAAASAASALAFNGKARVTIREVSEDNKPSPIIFFEFYDVPIEQSSFSFADTYNSSKIVELIQDNFYQNEEEKYVVTNNFTLDRVPLRHFDVVVEGYNGKTLKFANKQDCFSHVAEHFKELKQYTEDFHHGKATVGQIFCIRK